MPCTPMALRASRTSSSLNGLTIAVTIFMVEPFWAVVWQVRPRAALAAHGRWNSEALRQRDDEARLVYVAVEVLLGRADDRRGDRHAAAGDRAQVVRGAELVVGVVRHADGVLQVARITRVADVAVQRQALDHFVVGRQ